MRLARLPLPLSLIAVLAVTLVWSARSARAEGSCSWEDIAPLLREQAGLLSFLEESLLISSGGLATRLGPAFPGLEGRRIGPYRFEATSRRDPETRFELAVETRPAYFDAGGAPLPDERATEAAAVRESFAAIRLSALAPEDGPAEPGDAERTAWIQSRCNQLNLADHRLRTIDFPPDADITGRAILHLDPLSGRLDFFTVDAARGPAAVSESYYFHEGELIFAFRRVQATEITETGWFFRNGEIYQAHRKSFGADGSETREEVLPLAQGESGRLFARVSRLALAVDPSEVAEVYREDPALGDARP